MCVSKSERWKLTCVLFYCDEGRFSAQCKLKRRLTMTRIPLFRLDGISERDSSRMGEYGSSPPAPPKESSTNPEQHAKDGKSNQKHWKIQLNPPSALVYVYVCTCMYSVSFLLRKYFSGSPDKQTTNKLSVRSVVKHNERCYFRFRKIKIENLATIPKSLRHQRMWLVEKEVCGAESSFFWGRNDN